MKTLLILALLLLNCRAGEIPCRGNSFAHRSDFCPIDKKAYKMPVGFGRVEIDSTIAICQRVGVPVCLAFGLIYTESRFDSTARNKVNGCWGYLQLNPKYFDAGNRFDNLRQGLTFLREMHDALGTWDKAVRYFNSGAKMNSRKAYIHSVFKHC